MPNASVKSTYKKYYSCNPSRCICENSKPFKHIVDDSVIACDESFMLRLFFNKYYQYYTNKHDKYYTNQCVNKLR